MTVKKGSRHRVAIEKFADKGKSIARLDGYVVFVPGAVPGDEADVLIRRTKKKYAEAEMETLVTASVLRTDPRCRYFGACGGCKWQHVKYDAQLAAKRQSVQDAFLHTGGFEDAVVSPIIGAEDTYFYRNKMEFSFSANRWLTKKEIASGERFEKDFALGLHAPGQFAKVIDIEECFLQSEESVHIVNAVRELARTRAWAPWDTRKQKGLLRHLVIREGKHTGERMVNLVLARHEADVINAVAETLIESGVTITTLVATINDTPAQTALGNRIDVVFGPGHIRETLGDYEFRLGPQTFFQTNTRQAEKLYDIVQGLLGPDRPKVLYDVYCGAGTIGISLSAAADYVVGIEVVAAAVRDADANAASNGVTNCVFEAGDVLKKLDDLFVERHGPPDVLVVDPPRAGLHPRVAKRIANMGAPRVIYVSCNPQTQARDVALMAERYTIEALQPIDLFPHTDHVENVALLTLDS